MNRRTSHRIARLVGHLMFLVLLVGSILIGIAFVSRVKRAKNSSSTIAQASTLDTKRTVEQDERHLRAQFTEKSIVEKPVAVTPSAAVAPVSESSIVIEEKATSNPPPPSKTKTIRRRLPQGVANAKDLSSYPDVGINQNIASGSTVQYLGGQTVIEGGVHMIQSPSGQYITGPDGTQVIQDANGLRITRPDGAVIIQNSRGQEFIAADARVFQNGEGRTIIASDGTQVIQNSNGRKIIGPNGTMIIQNNNGSMIIQSGGVHVQVGR